MDAIIEEAVAHITLAGRGRDREMVFTRLTAEVVGLYRDARVDLARLLVFYPELLDARTDIALHAASSGFEEGGLALLETNHRVISRLLERDQQGGALRLAWRHGANRAFYRSESEYVRHLALAGRPREAVRVGWRLLQHDPLDRCMVRTVLARAMLLEQEFDRVLALCARYQADGAPELLLAEALACLRTGREEEAFLALARAYRRCPAAVAEVAGERPSGAPENPETGYGSLWQTVPGAPDFARRFLGARA